MRHILILAGLAASVGCAKQTGTYEVAKATGSAEAATAATAEAESHWAKRGDAAELEKALALYQTAYEADPTNRELAVRLTRGYYFLGDVHKTEKADKEAAWQESIGWGKRCVAINSEFTALLEKGDEDEASATRVTTKDDVPCLYWTATSLGKWAKSNGIAKSLKHLGTVKAYISRVEELDSSYYYAAVDRYWGAYYSALPSFAGQDLDKSKVHFDKSIEAAPDNFATRVLLASYWAVKTQDRAVFDENLEFVLNADPTVIPELEPENRAEQAKAEAWKAKADDLFVQ